MTNPSADAAAPSKTVATWLALLGGGLGLHRFYLHGSGDPFGWLFLPPTLIGSYGFWRLRHFGVDDTLGSWLVPLLGVSLTVAMLNAIVCGLTSETRWRDRHALAADAHEAATGWPVVIGVILALAFGAGIAMATVAFCAQRYFEATTG
ncbi:MAG: hypothetical protein M3Z16_03480 [Pseudomonadota bacterium]|nr:hypothetical protein [Pseudomonadota bacterium]